MKRFYLAAALILLAGFAAAAQDPAPPADEHPKLPAGEGREVLIRVCSSCHSADVVADQDLDGAGWKDLVDEMASMGADATDAQLAQITHYLAAAFPPSR